MGEVYRFEFKRMDASKIIVSGEGSSHPKLGVKKANTVEKNLQVLSLWIESGKLSLDHAIAKTRPGGTLRGAFKAHTDAAMTAHVDALYDLCVDYKKRLVPGYDPAAPVPKAAKSAAAFEPEPPVCEAAKTGRATCKISGELIAAGEVRCGLPSYAAGRKVTAWAKASRFAEALRFEAAPDNRSKCKASGDKIPSGAVRLCARVGTADQLAANADEKSKVYYLPAAVSPFFRDFVAMAPFDPAAIAGLDLLDAADRAALFPGLEAKQPEATAAPSTAPPSALEETPSAEETPSPAPSPKPPATSPTEVLKTTEVL